MYNDIKSPKELYTYMRDNIKYGFVSRDGEVFVRALDDLYDKNLHEKYFLQSPEEVLNSHYGLCFDQVLFARSWLRENGYNVQAFYTPYHNHSFLAYKDKDIGRYVLFERAMNNYNGLKSFYGLSSLINYYIDLQKVISGGEVLDIDIYYFNDIEYGLGFNEVVDSLKSGEKVLIR